MDTNLIQSLTASKPKRETHHSKIITADQATGNPINTKNTQTQDTATVQNPHTSQLSSQQQQPKIPTQYSSKQHPQRTRLSRTK
jgi:hypothetical protein